MASETNINVVDRDATIGARAGGNALTGVSTREQRSVTISALTRSDALAESIRVTVYGDRQTRELIEGLEAAARALRSTLPDVEPDDVEVAGDALSGLAEAGGR